MVKSTIAGHGLQSGHAQLPVQLAAQAWVTILQRPAPCIKLVSLEKRYPTVAPRQPGRASLILAPTSSHVSEGVESCYRCNSPVEAMYSVHRTWIGHMVIRPVLESTTPKEAVLQP